jgi:Tetratricopeptide repeat
MHAIVKSMLCFVISNFWRPQSGKFSKALKKFEAILASILERFGETHHRVGAALHNVGIANLRAGKLADAMDAIEEAVRIRKTTLGPDDPKVAVSTLIRMLRPLQGRILTSLGSLTTGFTCRARYCTPFNERVLRLS